MGKELATSFAALVHDLDRVVGVRDLVRALRGGDIDDQVRESLRHRCFGVPSEERMKVCGGAPGIE